MNRILLSGASGFIGRHVARSLIADGADLVAIGRGARPAHLDARVGWHQQDVLRMDQASTDVIRAIGAECFIHLAWETDHGHFWHEPSNLDWLAASSRLVKAFLAGGGQRIVGIGTCAEYMPPLHGPCYETRTELAAAPLYCVAKDAFRRASQCAAATAGASFAWGRVFLVYGEHENPARLVPSVIRALLCGKIANCSSGNQIRDFLDARDCGEAIAALAKSKVIGSVNIASGRPVPIADVVGRLADQLGRPELLRLGALPERAGDPPNLWGDDQRLRDEVGFASNRSLDDGLRDTINWWKNQSLAGEPNR